jgi:methylated-DNA-protein-cysteine methyltransferase-like protein
MSAGFFEQALELVCRVPPGRVVTYGQVARMLGHPGAARMVGWALHSIPVGRDVPWHRVINAQGGISPRGDIEDEVQRSLLEEEGLEFDHRGHLDLERYTWNGRPQRGRRR